MVHFTSEIGTVPEEAVITRGILLYCSVFHVIPCYACFSIVFYMYLETMSTCRLLEGMLYAFLDRCRANMSELESIMAKCLKCNEILCYLEFVCWKLSLDVHYH